MQLRSLMVGLVVLLGACNKEAPSEAHHTIGADGRVAGPVAQSAAPTPVPAPRPTTPPTVKAAPAIVLHGGWAKIPRPGEDIADTPETREEYTHRVLQPVSGEPKINTKAATALLTRLRASMAKQGSFSVGSVEIFVDAASGSLLVSPGARAGLSVHGEDRHYPICSEAFLGTGMILGDLQPSDFAKAGMRGLRCKSDSCTAVFDMRPTSSGGGMYTGSACLSIGDMMKLATE